jgi:hypothetical protein
MRLSLRCVCAASAMLVLVCCKSEPRGPSPIPPSGDTDDSTTFLVPPPSPTESVAPLAPAPLQKYCHAGDPLAEVYSPGRLTVKNPCVAVTGLVWSTNIEHDGDLHIALTEVDPKWLNSVNLQRLQQDLVLEVVPGIPVPAPAVQSRITVIGPWVLDTQTGWLEVHPVWAILPAD